MRRRKARRTIEHDLFGREVREDSINSKEKGDNNELVLAKLISKWTGVPFARVPRSGGLRWQNAPNVCGDIACTDVSFDFDFVLETKHYKKFAMVGDLRVNSKILTIWHKAVEDAQRAGGKETMLFLRQNGMPVGEYMLFMESRYLSILPAGVSVLARVSDEKVALIGMSSTEFISAVSYKELHNFVLTWKSW